ncbi:type IV secretory system conjugative DNA transfer family protein, partial [Salmonella enterica]|nr:type IV secretory system conjugative DNA transfer family protein [Salmonella enterica]
MSLKLPDKGQWAFIGLVMCLVTYYTGSVAVYFLNGKTPLYIWKNFDSMLLWRIITESNIRTDIRLTAIPSLLSGMVSSLIVPVFIIWQLNKTDVALYGDAKFASDNDLRKSKLLKWEKENDTDILVGAYKGKYLWYTAPDFVSLGAGTRAGKGAAIGIPNLLVRKHSLIALDPKQELWKITSKVREILLGNKVYLLDPFNSKTHQFNPLFYIDLKAESGAKDLLKLIEILFPSYGMTGAEAHFNNLAGQYWTGLAKLLHFFINYEPSWLNEFGLKPVFSIGSVVDLYSNIDRELILSKREELEGTNGLDENALYHLRDALTKIREYHETEDEQRSSIDGSFRKKMSLFYLPTVRKCTDGNDFDLR